MMVNGKIFKAIVGACISLSIFTACESQMLDLDSTRTTTAAGSKVAESKIFYDPEQQPSFPGGTQALLDFLDQNVSYPANFEGCAQGRVVVTFTINADGSISDPKVVRSLDKQLDAEALRVVGLMPKWIPAKMNGKSKKSKYTLPIVFKLK